MGGFEERVYAACSRIGRGRVSTYAEVARAVGSPGAYRAVGNALNKNRSKKVPCHRVVLSNGRVGGFAKGGREKQRMLKAEGVGISKGRVKEFGKKFQAISS